MKYYDKDKIKHSLSIEDVFRLVQELGGNPSMLEGNTAFTATTICHGGKSHKLYYYDNSQLFQCFTNCGYFDIYELVSKVKNVSLGKAIQYIVAFYHIGDNLVEFSQEGKETIKDWILLEKYQHRSSVEIKEPKTAELNLVNPDIIKFLPTPRILDWEEEGITEDIMSRAWIKYNPSTQAIVIPHFDPAGNMVGVRERTLIKEDEVYGKYRPAIYNKQMYNHPLSFNLYNLNNSKENIRKFGIAVVFEGEKSALKYASYFGKENDISVAICGSSLSPYQVELLLKAGAEEIIIAFDKQFKVLGDEEYTRWTKKLRDIHNKYGATCKISFMFDTEDLLGYKDSPIDAGKDTFMQLFKERILL